jgi:hypothetical protein
LLTPNVSHASEVGILKVLNPLFLDDLRAKLDEASDNSRTLLNLRKRMSRIRVFDPACGSGNFLVIAYKEMRAIEAEINERRKEEGRKSEIPLTNFRGIEIRDFPAEVARLALIIAEYQCDVLYRGQKEALAEFLPLDAENWITCGNALRLNWLTICPPTGTGVKHHADDLFHTPLDQAQIDFENEGGETATYSTRSALQAAMSPGGLRMQSSTRPFLWRTCRSLRPTAYSISIAESSKMSSIVYSIRRGSILKLRIASDSRSSRASGSPFRCQLSPRLSSGLRTGRLPNTVTIQKPRPSGASDDLPAVFDGLRKAALPDQ